MILIAHRGLISGPNNKNENRPEHIIEVLNAGYDVEIDFWINDTEFYLGHDSPQYKISRKFLEVDNLWIHAKNLSALLWLTTTDFNYFWHQSDDFTLTSKGFIWTYPGKELTSRSIAVMPEWKEVNLSLIKSYTCFGVCSDYVSKL